MCRRRDVLVLLLLCTACGQMVHAENVTVMEGEMAEITCKLHSYDGSIVVIQNPNRQTLFFNGTRALKDDRFRLVSFTQHQLRIALSDVRVEDEGGYYCQLYTEDTHHQVAVVTVLVPPKPTVRVLGEPARENGEVELQCTVPRSKPPARIHWIRDKKKLQGVTTQEQQGKIFTVTSVVKIPVVRKDDGTIVTCEADLPGVKGQKRRTEFPLSVRYSPTAKVEPPPVILREGDDLVLSCSVTGNPLPTQVTWSRLNDSLPERAEPQGQSLTVRRLTAADNGTYVCEVHTEMGSATDQYVLVVYEVPTTACTPRPSTDPGAVVEPQTATSYAIVGGVLAVFVFIVLCTLIVTVWVSLRQKGSYLTHEASRLDEHGEVREAFINGNENHELKKEYFI
ncbi:cell adhesion molecule 4 isoform X4 [Pristis pectinata]|uniref:cell adhesion molecule 4 isoform X4 n=1 Tax=Pristis pectinata TaxID=685728 RepID=UPI00223E69F7|nr:cell adhesion molecule 4 isoform X4 [Pristis pectinata]